jgi:hypothetical protein
VLFEEGAGRGIWSLALEQVQRLEMSVGQHNMYGPYILTGAMLGAGAGAIGGLVFASTASPSDNTRKYSRPLTASVGALVGTAVGALIGSRRKAERFAPIPVPHRMSMMPSVRGLRFGYGY